MKVLYVSSSTVPSRAANSVHVMKMCQAIAKLGHDVRLLVLHRPEIEEAEIGDQFEHYGVDRCFEIVAKPFPSIPGRSLIYGLNAWSESRQWKPDLAYGRYFPAVAMLGLSGIPVAYESHERLWDRGALVQNLGKKLFSRKNFCKLVVISEALKKMYVDEEMAVSDQIVVAHDGADPARYFVEPTRKSFKVGYIGGVYPGRGIEMILECAKRLPNVEFHFVGGMQSDLEGLQVNGVGTNVRCHGYVPPEKIPELRASFHVLLAPYQKKVAVWGGKGDTSSFMSPLKIFEYMAAGRPMICSDLPVLREVLDEDNTLLCDPENTDAWVEAIERLRNDHPLALRLAAKALADFEAYYTWDIRAERILRCVMT